MLSTSPVTTTMTAGFFDIRPVSVAVAGCLLLLIAVGLAGTILWDWMKKRREKKQQQLREQANVEIAFGQQKDIDGKNIHGVLWGDAREASSARTTPKEEKHPLMTSSRSSKLTEPPTSGAKEKSVKSGQ